MASWHKVVQGFELHARDLVIARQAPDFPTRLMTPGPATTRLRNSWNCYRTPLQNTSKSSLRKAFQLMQDAIYVA